LLPQAQLRRRFNCAVEAGDGIYVPAFLPPSGGIGNQILE